jgi:hypothetical protein
MTTATMSFFTTDLGSISKKEIITKIFMMIIVAVALVDWLDKVIN